ncbi:hypothetical protein BC826DRAFT_587246 [Russula brevipes]|nr:hypothetical protein BC826DRAFT_587246 [Russula brevipes]
MAQICSGLAGTGTGTAALLMPIEELILGFHKAELPQEWRDEVDPALWRALLAPFRQVRTLRIHVALAADLGPALGPPPPQPDTAGGLALLGAELEQQLFPELRTVLLLHGDEEAPVLAAASEAFGAFIKARNRAGRPVNVEPQNLSRLWLAPAAAQSATSSLLRKEYHRPALHPITASE